MDESLLQEAEQLAKTLREVGAFLRRPEAAAIASQGLTGPQIDVLRELAENNGLSLKELSQRLGLAHSTVSGIVDRLEQHGFVHRQPDPDDKRFTRVYAEKHVEEFPETTMYSWRGSILADALRQATPEEREQIIAGVKKLYTLLAAGADHE